jgi:Trk K+ transport system NAD-binding subunit
MKTFYNLQNNSFNFWIVLVGLFFSTNFTAQVYTTVPYSTGFESGVLDPAWTATSSLPGGEISIFTSGVLTWSTQTAYSHSGTKFLGMHYPTGGAYNLNEAKLHLNLLGQSSLRMSVWWAEWNDETEAQDGIYISDDGGLTYVKVVDLPGASYTDLTWVLFDMSLDSINTVHNLSFTSTYIIKFQQYDNYYFAGGNDGHLYDDISIYSVCGTTSTISPTVCSSYTVPSGNATYTTSGVYTDTILNSANCDSIITINLTVGQNASSITESACDSYTSPSGNDTYTSSGVYMDTLQNINGCDSVITINLTVNNSYSSNISVTACDSFVAPDQSVYTISGVYPSVLTSAGGCDSTITVDLTINNSTSSTITETALDTYTSPSGAVYTTSGTYVDTVGTVSGCDSVITINLTVGYTGLAELSNGIKLTIYPNPTNGLVKMTASGELQFNEMYLTDLTGARVLTIKTQVSEINLSKLSSGVYYLNIRHSDGLERIKLIKE